MQAIEERFLLSTFSPDMQPVLRLLTEIAPTDIPVLVTGESGTGKEVLALQIHALSNHRDLPFVRLSCAACCTESFQMQLREFGRGPDTGNGECAGTLFFDEINELDTDSQRLLLHLFPEGSGVNGKQTLAGRIISCTTHDLESEVHGGQFRSELYYRLSGVCLKVPPLRKRKEDIPQMAQFFLTKYSKLFRRKEVQLSDRTLRTLGEYSWPGNIRELENVIKKIVALENEELVVSELSARPAACAAQRADIVRHSLKEASRAASRRAERELILQTLTQTHWNRKKAAEALQISYKSLLYKLKQIQVPDSKGI